MVELPARLLALAPSVAAALRGLNCTGFLDHIAGGLCPPSWTCLGSSGPMHIIADRDFKI